MKTSVVVFLITIFAAAAVAPQTFEVVSVKPNVSGNPAADLQRSPQRFSWTNATLRQLILLAYDVWSADQLAALPEWTSDARFDVAAETGSAVSPDQMNTMVQGVLADRFDLVAHREKRELPVYTLVLARRDGKLGPGMHPSTTDCEAPGNRPLDSSRAQSEYDACSPQLGLTRLKAGGRRLSFLAGALTRLLDKTVIDKTGLEGTFDFELSWVPDPMMLPNGVPAPNPAAGGPSLFTALEEQLGVKLVSARAPVEVLVIDRINRPKPD